VRSLKWEFIKILNEVLGLLNYGIKIFLEIIDSELISLRSSRAVLCKFQINASAFEN